MAVFLEQAGVEISAASKLGEVGRSCQIQIAAYSVVDPVPESDPYPGGTETFYRIRIHSRIRNKSFRILIWARAALIRNEFETKLL